MTTIFLTGFPGFLGSELLRRLLDRFPADERITCLVQHKFRAQAEARAAELTSARGDPAERVQLVDGDITRPDLGLSPARRAQIEAVCVEIYHLAAVYALGVARDPAMRINVDGTRHMLRLAIGCPRLRRFHYVSTCYVSGRHEGPFAEDDLRVGQTFNNHYEETKYYAELEVQAHMARGLPVTIYRPSIVVGDSQTGATQKFDGPYYGFQWILRQGDHALLPDFGGADRFEVNVVPRDYVIDAIAYLSARDASVGRVYHLSDPRPVTVREMSNVIAEVSGKHIWPVRLPAWLVRGALSRLPAVYDFVRMDPAMIDYFTLPTRYECRQTLRDLAGSGIVCPPFAAYAPALVRFMQRHPDIATDPMA